MYKIKSIDDDFIEMVFSNLDPESKIYKNLRSRGGYFKNNPFLNYAVDDRENNFLFLGPKDNYKSRSKNYYFYFCKTFYHIRVESLTNREAVVIDAPKSESFYSDLKEAFSVYGYLGMGADDLAVEVKANG